MKMKLCSILVLISTVTFAGCKKEDSIAYQLYITTTSGTIIRNPAASEYKSGALVQLTASPNSGYTFSSWSGDAIGSANPLTITMNGNKHITANFTAINGQVVNVRNTGAKGDGVTDDTAALQSAVDQVAGTGGTVSVPAGTYMINALVFLKLKSNMTLKMEGGAILKALPNNSENYSIIRIEGVSNVRVTGGTVYGERATHLSTSGQWGFGVDIRGSYDVVIEGVTAKDCFGDGFYIANSGTTVPKNITLDNVIADNNRRQGLSIVGADGVIIRNSILQNTQGRAPGAGIDIEPNTGCSVRNVQILNSQFLNNAGGGIFLWLNTKYPNTFLENVTIDGNTIADNGAVGSQGIVLMCLAAQKVTNNIIRNNYKYAMTVDAMSNGFITGNTITNTRTEVGAGVGGIYIRNATEDRSAATTNTITGNTVTGHSQNMRTGDASNIVHPNTVGTISLSAATYSVAENVTNKTATVTVTRTGSGPGYGAATVKYATSNGTATAGSDYTTTSGTLSWADGDVSDKTFTVTITSDTLTEGPESVIITLSDIVGALVGTNKSAVLTITE
ncbi:MAG: right-handed parallel beta-helix repeat-containing protein [Prolixibacteraceae bacterium]|nr:right-handed parallel beta-helix repeat-containing protein [Prolixibacteraceae bacterium]